MNFGSPVFLFLFLPVTLSAYLLAPARLRNALLLLASLCFYVLADRFYVGVLLLAVAGNYGLGLLLGGAPAATGPPFARVRPRGRWRWLLLLLAVVLDLGLLVYWKHGSRFSSPTTLGAAWSRERHLPLGISFFTCALLAYLLDVYRGRMPAERNPLRFALFVSFFPKVVAGPIVRFQDMATALRERPVRLEQISSGVQRFVVGLAKKMLIANTLAPAVDEIFGLPPGNLTPSLAWLGAVAYGIWIYFDFSGYSDMAIGLARMFGFDFMENFRYPYMARSICEFWRRWHISLSSWFRDYVFLPLAYRMSRWPGRDHRLDASADMLAYAGGVLVTMFLCGLWHGAQWTFALWGLWHGLFMVLENTPLGKRTARRLRGPLRPLVTQLIVLVGWVIFRSPDLGGLGRFLAAMAGLGVTGAPAVRLTDYLNRPLAGALALGILFSFPIPALLAGWRERAALRGPLLRAVLSEPAISAAVTAGLLALFVFSAMSAAGETYAPFVYRQF